VQRLAATATGAGLLARVLHRADPIALRLTGDRWTITEASTGLPVVLLHTTGARTGRPRCSPLVAVRIGADLALIGSNFGGRRHPGWVHNVWADPQVIVQRGGRALAATARPADGEQAERIWRQARDLYPGFASYPTRTAGRPVPVFVLEPVEPTQS
jgi:deazaflavin-dependent oxidoreductase (nitroreductase family)